MSIPSPHEPAPGFRPPKGVGFLRQVGARYGLHRLALHASLLWLPHPETGQRCCCTAPVPEDLGEPLARMGVPLELRR